MTTLPIMTFLFSSISTLIQALVLAGFGQRLLVNKEWVLTDLLLLPAQDALFAFIVFIFPYYFFGKPMLRGRDYFMNGEEGSDASAD